MPGKVVFISYSHDSDEHQERVLGLAKRLRQDGVDARIDQYVNGTPEQGWPRWMLDRFDEASFILVVCTETYYRRFRGREEPGRGKGADWEGALITQEIYDARSRTVKFVPVLFSVGQEPFIPEPLRSHTYYELTSEKGYHALYEFLLGEAGVEPGPLGPIKPVSKRVAQLPPFNPALEPPLPAASSTVSIPQAVEVNDSATSRPPEKPAELDRRSRITRRLSIYIGAAVLILALAIAALSGQLANLRVDPSPYHEAPVLTSARGGRNPTGEVVMTLVFSTNIPPESQLKIEIGESPGFEKPTETHSVTDWQSGRVTLPLEENRSEGYVRLHFFGARGEDLVKSREKYFRL